MKCAYFFAGIDFYRVICDKIAIVIKTSNTGTRCQPQIKREQAWHLLKKLDIFTLAGPDGLDPRPPKLNWWDLSADSGWAPVSRR